MDEQLGKLVVGSGAAIGVAVWFAVLRLYGKMASAPAVERVESIVSGKSSAEAIKGVVDSCRQMASQVRLSRPTETSLEIRQAGVTMLIAAERAGGQTVLIAEVDDSSLRRTMLKILAIFALAMPVVIVGGAAVLWIWAAPSNNPALRWQSVQIVQIVHVLWPPFLVYFIWKRMRIAAVNAVSNLMVLANAA